DGGSDGAFGLLGVVGATEEGQATGIEGLDAHAEALDPHRNEPLDLPFVEARRVPLDGHLLQAAAGELLERLEYAPELLWLPQRGRPSAEEDAPDGAAD